MNILGISGSPVHKGNNERIITYALDYCTKQGFTTEICLLSEQKVGPCSACDACRTRDICSISDAMDTIDNQLRKADGIIVTSPVYFGSVSAQLKCLFDRTLRHRRNNFLLKDKPGIAIAVGRSRNGGQEYTIQNIHAWMHIHGMIVLGDNNHFGGAVQADFDADTVGKTTINDAVAKLCGYLSHKS